MVGQQYWVFLLIIKSTCQSGICLLSLNSISWSIDQELPSLSCFQKFLTIDLFNLNVLAVLLADISWLESYCVYTFIGSKPHIQARHFCVHTCVKKVNEHRPFVHYCWNQIFPGFEMIYTLLKTNDTYTFWSFDGLVPKMCLVFPHSISICNQDGCCY